MKHEAKIFLVIHQPGKDKRTHNPNERGMLTFSSKGMVIKNTNLKIPTVADAEFLLLGQ